MKPAEHKKSVNIRNYIQFLTNPVRHTCDQHDVCTLLTFSSEEFSYHLSSWISICIQYSLNKFYTVIPQKSAHTHTHTIRRKTEQEVLEHILRSLEFLAQTVRQTVSQSVRQSGNPSREGNHEETGGGPSKQAIQDQFSRSEKKITEVYLEMIRYKLAEGFGNPIQPPLHHTH
jgi:hypothetical protein